MAGPTPNTTFNASATPVVPSYVTPLMQCVESGVVTLYGSFVVASAAIATSSIRGNDFTVTYTSTGLYRVTVQQSLPNGLVAVNAVSGQNGNPKGLLAPPHVWFADENLSATAVTQAQGAKGFVAYASLYDTTTNLNTFDIMVYAPTPGSPQVFPLIATDTTIDTRICFSLAFKNVAYTP